MIRKTEKSPFSHIPENKGILFISNYILISAIANQFIFWKGRGSGRTMTVA